MKRITSVLWSLVIILTLGIGIVIGARVITYIAERDAKAMQTKLDETITERDEARAELKAKDCIVIAWDALASYYTESSSGEIQANGQKFDEDRLTAAHRSLPFGTLLLLENMENGKWSSVMIEDRGPAEWTGRTLDVSLAVAQRLGIVKLGEAQLRCYMLVKGRLSKED
jgi:rare lipoprotein A (peptidoglycan hydrolase)